MAGEHNALNATAAAALAAGHGIPVTAAIVEALATFRSVKRRLEIVAEVAGITVIDDFAHHPTAIRETLRALRQRLPRPSSLGRPRAPLQHPTPPRLRDRTQSTPSLSPTRSSSPASSAPKPSPSTNACTPTSGRRPARHQRHPRHNRPEADAIVAHLARHTRPATSSPSSQTAPSAAFTPNSPPASKPPHSARQTDYIAAS